MHLISLYVQFRDFSKDMEELIITAEQARVAQAYTKLAGWFRLWMDSRGHSCWGNTVRPVGIPKCPSSRRE